MGPQDSQPLPLKASLPLWRHSAIKARLRAASTRQTAWINLVPPGTCEQSTVLPLAQQSSHPNGAGRGGGSRGGAAGEVGGVDGKTG